MLFQEDNSNNKPPMKQDAVIASERQDLLKLKNKEFLSFKQDPVSTSLPASGIEREMKVEPSQGMGQNVSKRAQGEVRSV